MYLKKHNDDVCLAGVIPSLGNSDTDILLYSFLFYSYHLVFFLGGGGIRNRESLSACLILCVLV
jgi:hypothetical protein